MNPILIKIGITNIVTDAQVSSSPQEDLSLIIIKMTNRGGLCQTLDIIKHRVRSKINPIRGPIYTLTMIITIALIGSPTSHTKIGTNNHLAGPSPKTDTGTNTTGEPRGISKIQPIRGNTADTIGQTNIGATTKLPNPNTQQ